MDNPENDFPVPCQFILSNKIFLLFNLPETVDNLVFSFSV